MQSTKWLPMSAGLVLSAFMLGSTVQADEASLQQQLNSQQTMMLNQQNQLYQMQQDIASLRGEIEQLRYQLNRSGTATTAAATPAPATTAPAAAANTTTTQNGMGPVTPMGNANLNAAQQGTTTTTTTTAPAASAAAATTLPGVDATAQAAYNAAYAKVQQNDLSGAQSAFRQYVEQYPNNSLTPNAWYWLGQVQYSQAIYDEARLSFLNVARYTSSQKRPDALYKLGMISKFTGDTDKATRYFQLVIQSYPNDAAASLATRELQRLQG